MFRKYHYLNTDLHQAATQYVAMWGNEVVAHTGIIQFPMRRGWKRVHRLVVLPDYQGVGIGMAFIAEVARITKAKGYDVNLTTTTPALVHALKRSAKWLLFRFGRCTNGSSWQKYGATKHMLNSMSDNRVTYSFNYKGD